MTQDRRDTVAPPPQQPTIIKEHDARPQRLGWAPGDYLNKCRDCDCRFMGDKRAWHCADCAYKASPQQPTTEALSEALDYLDFPEVPWDKIKDALLPETRNQIISLATLLDRFAAQRVVAAEQEGLQCPACNWHEGHDPSEWFREEVHQRGFLWWQNDVTTATDKARREAIEECAHFVENGIFLTDSSPAYRFANECAAAIRRALTPQNPGDAARDENA